ncbi:MAG: TrmH family RNA methyltransferase, partial [Waddliaceae bacterium]
MFTKRKFLQFPLAKQHKKCAEMLRSLYTFKDPRLLSHYNEIQQWMRGEELPDPDHEAIGNRYHEHLQEAHICLREHDFLPRVRHGDKKSPVKEPRPIAIYLDNIRSAHNVGSILRTVEAFSLGHVYFSPKTPFITHRQVQKTSMGTFSSVRCSRISSLDDLLKPLVVMETTVDAASLYDFLFPEQFTLVVGNE